METETKVKHILEELDNRYPDPRLALNFSNAYELLVATILAAQCTDVRVNEVTPDLFAKYPDAASLAKADREELEEEIKSTGFYRNKTKSLLGCAKALVENHGGDIPRDLDALVELPGVGRKTGNVVLGGAYGLPGIAVDTHVSRVSQRLGLTSNTDPVKIEFDLNKIIPREKWTRFSHQLTLHGRETCVARKPKCSKCPLPPWCDYYRDHVHSA